ncbi:MAG: hypothetical protein KF764_31550 [Labilithrix sp.]|nr:hypothetical protein [Labilithrix sp.]
MRVRVIVTGGTRLERALVAQEIARTTESPSELEAELAHLGDARDDALGDVLNWADVTVMVT